MPASVPLSGRLEENSLPRILNRLHEIKGSGTLALTREGVVKNLYLKSGAIIFASSTYEGDRLGEILLKVGKISVKQYEMASKVIKQTGKRLGGVLVELGYLRPKDLFWGVKHQVQEIVCSLFSWTDGEYQFKPGDAPSGEVITLHMSTANLILQGVKRIDDWTRISRGIPRLDGVLRVTSNPLRLYQDVDMSEEERHIISLFDGKRTIKEAFESSNMGDFEALKAVYVLYSIGLLENGRAEGAGPAPREEKRPAGAAERPLDKTTLHKAFIDSKGQNYYEILRIDSEAATREIEEAYRRLARLYHPDQQFKAGMEALRDELDELFNKVTEAYTILSDDSRRWEYDLSLATVMTGRAGPKRGPKDADKARESFEKGVKRFKARDFESATVEFKEAVRLDSGNAGYHSHLALALLQRPRREAEAEEAMLAAVSLEPENADHRANLGLLYQRAGMTDKAREAFAEALRLDPKNPKALKGLGKR